MRRRILIRCALVATLGLGAGGCCSSREFHGLEPPPPELCREVGVLVNEILSREYARALLQATKEEDGAGLAVTQKVWDNGRELRRAAITREVWEQVREFIFRRRKEVHEEVRRLAEKLTGHP